MSRKSDNYLLKKTELGEVKKGFHELPPDSHTYGKAPIKDKYGAREGTQINMQWSAAGKRLSQQKAGKETRITFPWTEKGLKMGMWTQK